MDSEKTKWLSDKYWKSESSIAEEQELRKIAQDKEQTKALAPEESAYFNVLNEVDNLKLDESFEKSLFQKIEREESLNKSLSLLARGKNLWQGTYSSLVRIAATVLIILASGMIIYNASQQRKEAIAQKEAREAFEVTKQALLLVSAKLNKGASYTTDVIGKFDEAQQKVRGTNAKI